MPILEDFAQVCLTRFSVDLLQRCTVRYHEQENHFIEVLPSSWWSAGDWIALNLVSCYMTGPPVAYKEFFVRNPGVVASIYVKYSVVIQ